MFNVGDASFKNSYVNIKVVYPNGEYKHWADQNAYSTFLTQQ